MKSPLLTILVPVIAAILGGCGTQTPAAKPAASTPVPVTTATAALMDHEAIESLPGTVKAATSATIMARIPGTIARIAATPGNRVAAGANLVEVDAQEIIARRDQAQAAVAMAQAAVAEARAAATEAAAARKLADSEWARAKQLLAKEAMTRAEYDGAEAKASAAEARVAAAEARVTAASRRVVAAEASAAEAAVMVSYMRISAPFAGIVVRKHAEVGDLLAPGRPVMDLEDPASMRLEVQVPESLAARVTMGTKLRIQIMAAGLDQETTVVEVTPAADPVSRTVLAKLALPADVPTLRSGQFGRVTIASTGHRVLAVPAGAVMRRGQLDAVMVAQDGIAHLRLVRLGDSSGDRIFIRAGLVEGDKVVSDGADRLTDGQAVIPGPAASAP